MTQKRVRICGRYLAQHSAFADLVDYSEFTVVVDPTELESANILDILQKRHGRTSRLDMTERLHQVKKRTARNPVSYIIASRPRLFQMRNTKDLPAGMMRLRSQMCINAVCHKPGCCRAVRCAVRSPVAHHSSSHIRPVSRRTCDADQAHLPVLGQPNAHAGAV